MSTATQASGDLYQQAIEATAPPVIASPDDIDRDFAARAFNGTSFSPEKRGQSRREDYANEVNGLYAELWPLAATPQQRVTLADEMARYRGGLLVHMNSYLASHSRQVSSMITGPARFPVETMRKRSEATDNRLREMMAWREKARAAIRRKLGDLRPQETKDAEAWHCVARDISRSLNAVKQIDAGLEHYRRSAFTNSISGKVERIAASGDVATVAKCLQLVREWNATHKKPAFTARHKFWGFEDVAKQAAAALAVKIEEKENGPATESVAEINGAEIVLNHELDRVQIIFPAKPASEILRRLRSEGWNWSPSNGAWQRKLTLNAKASAVRMLA